MEAIVAFPAAIKQAFSQWVVGHSVIDDQDVQIVQGTGAGLLPVNLYFDTSGLLVRLVRWNQTRSRPGADADRLRRLPRRGRDQDAFRLGR